MAETDVQGIRIALVTIFLIAIAMVSGYRRGTMREAVTTVLLTFFASLPSTQLGVSLVDALNTVARQVRAVGFQLQALIPGMADAKAAANTLKDWRPIPLEQQEAFIFIVFLAGIFLAYRAGNFVLTSKRSPPSMGGALMGLFNAYILGLVLLPDLPRAVPAPDMIMNGKELTRQATETFAQVATSIGVTFSAENILFGIILLVAVLMYWAVNELR